MKKKVIFFLLGFFTFFYLFMVSTLAGEVEYGILPEGYAELAEGACGFSDAYIPEGIYSRDVEEVGAAVFEMLRAEYLLGIFSSALKIGMRDAVSLFARLSAVIVLSAIFRALKSSVNIDALSQVTSLSSSCAIFCCVISFLAEHFLRVDEFFERISFIMTGMIPVASVVYAMGGNISTAAVSGGTLYILLAFCEEICRTSVLPVAAVCTAFSLCGAFSAPTRLYGISSAIKKCYTFVLGLVMTILIATLSAQTVLSTAADSVSARAAKLVASNVIPIVGSSVGDTLRTVSSSIGYIKGVCGLGGIIFIILLVLPTLVALLLTRGVFIFAVAISDLVGCESEGKLLGELGSVYGILVAVVSMCSVMFILALAIFVRSTVAMG